MCENFIEIMDIAVRDPEGVSVDMAAEDLGCTRHEIMKQVRKCKYELGIDIEFINIGGQKMMRPKPEHAKQLETWAERAVWHGNVLESGAVGRCGAKTGPRKE